MPNWSNYYTPDSLADTLLATIPGAWRPCDAVDICAGKGSLLSAVSRRWPSVLLHANDVAPVDPKCEHALMREQLDGREFALRSLEQGRRFDLVVANPPFGRNRLSPAISSQLKSSNFFSDASKKLLASHRLEVSMLVANALLVAPEGRLLAIVPETLAGGNSHELLRTWLSERFSQVVWKSIDRGDFRNQDIGLCYLHAIRLTNPMPTSVNTPDSDGLEAFPARVEVVRGRLVSNQTTTVGQVPVVHCGGRNSAKGWSRRAVDERQGRIVSPVWISPGDIVVTRVGRMAGTAQVYDGIERAILTDCMLRIDLDDTSRRLVANTAILKQISEKINDTCHGLGARFCRSVDVRRIFTEFASQLRLEG